MWEVINYKIIHKILRNIQANASTIQSKLGGGHHGLLWLEKKQDTYRTVTGHEFAWQAIPPQAAPEPHNEYASEVPRSIQHNEDQVYQWIQMVNAEDTPNHQILESLNEKYFKGQRQVYTKYANRTLTGLIQNLYDDHGSIPPMDIEEREQEMNQEWSLLDLMVELIEKIEEGVELAEAANTPTP